MEVLALGVCLEKGEWSDRQAGADVDVRQFVATRGERLVERLALRVDPAEVEPHAGLDHGSSFRRRYASGLLVRAQRVHGVSLPFCIVAVILPRPRGIETAIRQRDRGKDWR
jgi:hypothetical protein